MSATTICEPIRWVYRPRGAAKALLKCKDREILIEGPSGTGKTRGVWEKILKLADKYAGSRHLACRKTRASMTDSVLVTFEEKVLTPGHYLARGPRREQRHSYRLSNGSEIVIGGLDEPSRTFSAEYDTVVVFEAIEASEDDWELLHRALRNGKVPYQQIIADTNPGPETHWLNQRANAGRMTRLLSRHEDNPEYWDADKNDWTDKGRSYVLGTLEALTGHRRQRLRFGRWVSAEGAVYESFDAAIHIVNPQSVPPLRRYVASVDWGYSAPGTIQVWGLDGDGRMYLVREIFQTRKLIGWWAQEAAALGQKFPIEAFACDPAEPAYIRAFTAVGLNAVEGYNAIEHGIQGVQDRLVVQPDGKPRLMLVSDCLSARDEMLAASKGQPVSVRQEFDVYTWPKGADGKPIREKPVDAFNHGMDAMRYAVAYVDDLGQTEIGYAVGFFGSV